jgi:hypothetical protein
MLAEASAASASSETDDEGLYQASQHQPDSPTQHWPSETADEEVGSDSAESEDLMADVNGAVVGRESMEDKVLRAPPQLESNAPPAPAPVLGDTVALTARGLATALEECILRIPADTGVVVEVSADPADEEPYLVEVKGGDGRRLTRWWFERDCIQRVSVPSIAASATSSLRSNELTAPSVHIRGPEIGSSTDDEARKEEPAVQLQQQRQETVASTAIAPATQPLSPKIDEGDQIESDFQRRQGHDYSSITDPQNNIATAVEKAEEEPQSMGKRYQRGPKDSPPLERRLSEEGGAAAAAAEQAQAQAQQAQEQEQEQDSADACVVTEASAAVTTQSSAEEPRQPDSDSGDGSESDDGGTDSGTLAVSNNW